MSNGCIFACMQLNDTHLHDNAVTGVEMFLFVHPQQWSLLVSDLRKACENQTKSMRKSDEKHAKIRRKACEIRIMLLSPLCARQDYVCTYWQCHMHWHLAENSLQISQIHGYRYVCFTVALCLARIPCTCIVWGLYVSTGAWVWAFLCSFIFAQAHYHEAARVCMFVCVCLRVYVCDWVCVISGTKLTSTIDVHASDTRNRT